MSPVSRLKRPAYVAFLRRLIAAREHAGLTTLQAADALGLTEAEVARMESGKQLVDVVETAYFAELYGQSYGYFAGVPAERELKKRKGR